MSWKEDRDALIAQTMAFVQSVSARGQGSSTATAEAALPEIEPLDASPFSNRPLPKTTPPAPLTAAEPAPSVPFPSPRPIVPGQMTSEIRARIADFRAHQQRFNRERDEYFSKTLARLKATLNEMPGPPRSDK